MSANDDELERIRRKKIEEIIKRGVPPKTVDTPVEVTDLNFDEIIKNNVFVVIDFWAPWCAPCRMMTPIIDEFAREYAGKTLFGKLNVDENQRTPIKYQVMSIPTFLFFKDGELVDRVVGAVPKKVLEQKAAKYI